MAFLFFSFITLKVNVIIIRPFGFSVLLYRRSVVWCMMTSSNGRNHFSRYRPFVNKIHLSLVNFPHKDQWCGALIFYLICAWTNGWVNNRDSGLRHSRTHYDVTVVSLYGFLVFQFYYIQKASCLMIIWLFGFLVLLYRRSILWWLWGFSFFLVLLHNACHDFRKLS